MTDRFRSLLRGLRAYQAVLAVGLFYGWSCLSVWSHRIAETPAGTVTLTIGHLQLEPGVRDGFNALAADYQRLHPGVRVEQLAIPEGVFGQWVTTQLIGGNAPDLLQVNLALPKPVWTTYLRRYFLPLTPFIGQPNPYNAGSPLAGEPWRATYLDGLRGAYDQDLFETMAVPLSRDAARIYFNRDLLRQLTGSDAPPRDLREFLAACRAIAARRDAAGQAFVPIASSAFHLQWWEFNLFDMPTYPVMWKADANRDGRASKEEMFAALAGGQLDFRDPAVAAKFRLVRAVADFFPPGFSGLTRDDAVLLFAQGRAVFIATGVWDAVALAGQAEGKFDLGVMDFPLPAADDPDYGRFVLGPRCESSGGYALNLGVTRGSRHPELALDFLRFITSQRGNEKLNGEFGWIPAIRGAALSRPLLRPFAPHLEGVYGQFNDGNMTVGGETWVKWRQLYSLFQVGQLTFEELMDRYGAFYRTRGLADYEETEREWLRNIPVQERLLAGLRARALSAGNAEEAAATWRKYRAAVRSKQVTAEVLHASAGRMVHDPAAAAKTANAAGPYELTPAALANVREQVRRRLEAERAPDSADRGAHAPPRALAGAPPDSLPLAARDLGGGAQASTRGACAPRNASPDLAP